MCNENYIRVPHCIHGKCSTLYTCIQVGQSCLMPTCCCVDHIVPVVLLAHFLTLIPTLLEHFSVLKSTTIFEHFRALKTTLLAHFKTLKITTLLEHFRSLTCSNRAISKLERLGLHLSNFRRCWFLCWHAF